MKGLIDNNDNAVCRDAVSSCRQLGECISARILASDQPMNPKRKVRVTNWQFFSEYPLESCH